MKSALLSAVVFVMLGTAASAATYVLDFDTTDASNTTLDSSATQTIADPRLLIDDGIRWLADAAGGNGAALFNSTCAGYGSNCNGDPDLSPASQANIDGVKGNVLIQQRPQSGPTPNDDAATDFISLTLDSDVSLIWTGVSAIDNGNYRFGTSVDASDLGSISLTGESETGSTTFASSVLTKGDVVYLFFDRAGSSNTLTKDSGAIDNLQFSVVPVPASLPLLVGGFGLMAFMRQRRKA